jgi:hypothetical protein
MAVHKPPDVDVAPNDPLPLLPSQNREKFNEIPSFDSPRIMHTFVKTAAHQLNEIWLRISPSVFPEPHIGPPGPSATTHRS